MTKADARPASTVVLLRRSPERFDVFLVRRHESMTFMGGAHVFPGGRVDDHDRLEQPDEICDGVAEAVGRMPMLSPPDAIGYYVAGVRELFEEAGVLLARDASGSLVAGAPERWLDSRRALAERRLTLADLARKEGVRLALDTLTPFAHWVTPEDERKRFDVRFFMAALPSRQDPSHDAGEMSEGVWLDPATAAAQGRTDAIALPPPTWTTIRTLERFPTLDAAFAWARTAALVPVQPRITERDGVKTLTLPGDPRHPALAGFDPPAETRFVLDGRRWRSIDPID